MVQMLLSYAYVDKWPYSNPSIRSKSTLLLQRDPGKPLMHLIGSGPKCGNAYSDFKKLNKVCRVLFFPIKRLNTF